MRRYITKSLSHAFSSDQPTAADETTHPYTATETRAAEDASASVTKMTSSRSAHLSDHPTPGPGGSPPTTTVPTAPIIEPLTPTSTKASYLPTISSIPLAIPSMRKYLFSTGTGQPPTVSPNLRHRLSASSSEQADQAVGRHEDTLLAPLRELNTLVEKTFGPVGQLKDMIAKDMPDDRLLEVLNKSVQDRNRILLQFLRARHMNPTEAMDMLTNAVRWRKSVDIGPYLTNAIENMFQPTACFPMAVISSSNRCKQPVIYGLIRLLDKKKAEREPFQKAMLSFLESTYFSEKYVIDEMVIIMDFRDWSIRRNAPYRLVKDGLQLLQDYYPERLARVFLVNYPTTIRAAYTAISPIIEAGAKAKIVWVSDVDPSTILLKYVSPKSIPRFLGGELDVTFPSTWPDVAREFTLSTV